MDGLPLFVPEQTGLIIMAPFTNKKIPGAWALIFCLCFSATGRGQDLTFTNFLMQGERAEQHNDVPGALKFYAAADRTTSTNCADLCVLARRYCDLMHLTSSPDIQKNLAERALNCSLRAVKADPKSATAHLCVAVSYVKNFPFVDNETEVNWSKAMKAECETGIALDPKQDVGYYLLGRWHFGVANMNFIYKGLVKIVYGGLPKASNEEAIKNFKHAIELAPNRIIHHAALAKLYETTGEKKLERTELEKCHALNPADRDDVDAQKEAEKRRVEIGK
jgi:tetratricopeptide (TPR) repeat protein